MLQRYGHIKKENCEDGIVDLFAVGQTHNDTVTSRGIERCAGIIDFALDTANEKGDVRQRCLILPRITIMLCVSV